LIIKIFGYRRSLSGFQTHVEKDMEEVRKLKYCSNGEWLQSATDKWMDIYDPSRGEVIAQAPC
jgi:malonate-semialdehyde dehydrogenase (acetylating)/methylmalonate-semialdehyde dehydrogenase